MPDRYLKLKIVFDNQLMEFQLDQAAEILKRTPATLNALLGGLSAAWTQTNEGDDSWTPFDVVGHLIHAEQTDWLPRVRNILMHGETRAFEPFDRFAMFENSKGKTLPELLVTFERLRAESLQELARLALTPEKLQLRGLHPELGGVTVGQLLATWVVHDLGHISQIVRVMAKQYRNEVGVWQAYLSILRS